MYKFINRTRLRLGIDKSIFWATLNRSFGFIKAPVSIYFIVHYLTPQDQGLWYTFNNLSALTLLAELGFPIIITQFVSHEFALLEDKNGTIEGDNNRVERLIGLIRFSIRFYAIIIPVALVVLTTVGYFYFKNGPPFIYLAWFLFSLAGGMNLLLGLFQSVYQGFDKVKQVQINAFICMAIGSIINWTMLYMHFRIWALVLGTLVGTIITSLLLYKSAPKFWQQVLFSKVEKGKYNFFNETIGLQGKYAISWMSGYFIYYLTVPAAYKFVGETLAGQLGITMSVIAAINAISLNWITTKIPKFNILVSKKDKQTLDQLYKKSLSQAVLMQAVLSVIFLAGLFFLTLYLPQYGSRFITIKLTAILLLSQIAQLLINAMAIYLRSHKEEPFVFVSVVFALLMVAAVGVGMRAYGFNAFIITECLILFLIILPLATATFFKYRKIFRIKYF